MSLSETKEVRLIPARMRILSGSMLKMIAIVAMLIDHVAHLFRIGTETVLFSLGEHSLTLYSLLRYVGRIAFPLFAFLLIEGFLHTKNRKKYAIRLSLFALISEIPFNLFCSGTLFYERQNVFFTLLLGFLALWAWEARDKRLALVIILGLFGVSVLLRADYGYTGFLFILLLYFLRSVPLIGAMMSGCTLSLASVAAFLPIGLYNGDRGFIRHGALKYLFYVFYPLHLMILTLIKHFL